MKRTIIWIVASFLIGIVVGVLIVDYLNSQIIHDGSARIRAFQYLIDSYNSSLGLCFEFNESRTYWLTHDNVLASLVLQQWNRTVADNITLTVQRLAQEYSLWTSPIGIPLDNKIDVLLGYDVKLPFNATQNIALNSSYHGVVLNTEVVTDDLMLDFADYADLACYASLAKWRENDIENATGYFKKTMSQWDGKGFKDKAYSNSRGYDTYKLALFYLVSKTLGIPFSFKEDLIETILSMQSSNGGFVTNYSSKGKPNPTSKTNTETTSIVLASEVI
jgi:hypothetical protein